MYKLIDYRCERCGAVEERLERRDSVAELYPCVCGGERTKRIGAPKLHFKAGWITPGKSQERPPWALDTRAMYEKGQTRAEWKAEQAKKRRDARWKQIKDAVG